MNEELKRAAEAYRMATTGRPVDPRRGVPAIRRSARRRAVGRGAAAAAVVTIAAVVSFASPREVDHRPVDIATPPSSAASDRVLADGSSIVWEAGSEVDVVTEGENVDTRIALRSGAAKFQVTPRRERAFVVVAGEIAVRVTGTVFEVRAEASHVEVVVHEGSVEVERAGQGVATLRAGERLDVPRVDGTVPSAPPSPPSLPEPPATASPSTSQAASPTRSGHAEPVERPAPPTAAELLSRADTERAAGDRDAAERTLREVVTRFDGSPSAATAAFTLGRMVEGNRPREALEAFRAAATHQPDGPLADEARRRAGRLLERLGTPAE